MKSKLYRILEWFLRDHVTVKTEVIYAKNVALPWQELINFKIYYNRKHFMNISQYYCFCDQLNLAFFQNH